MYFSYDVQDTNIHQSYQRSLIYVAPSGGFGQDRGSASKEVQGIPHLQGWSRRRGCHQLPPQRGKQGPKHPVTCQGHREPLAQGAQALALFSGTGMKSGLVSPVSRPHSQDQPCLFCGDTLGLKHSCCSTKWRAERTPCG